MKQEQIPEPGELSKKDILVRKSYSTELKIILPIMVAPLLYALYKIFTCGASCPGISQGDTMAGLLAYLIVTGLIIFSHMIYEGITLSSVHQATFGMRKLGIYVTRADTSRHSFLSTLIVYLPLFIWFIIINAKMIIENYLRTSVGDGDYFYLDLGALALVIIIFVLIMKKITGSRRYFLGTVPNDKFAGTIN